MQMVRLGRVMVIAVVIPVVLAGCSDDGGAKASGSPSVAATQGVDPAGPEPSTATSSAPAVAATTAPPVRVGTDAPILPKVTVDIGKVVPVNVKAEQPGDIAGSAVAVPVTVTNASGKPFDLGGMVVTASFAGMPGDSTSASPSAEMTGSLAAGKSGRGVYVFRVPAGQKASSLQLQVSSNQAPTVLQFAG